MPWRGHRKTHCVLCGKNIVGQEILSARGKCFDCGDGRARANATDLHLHDGEFFENWRQAMARSVGAVLLDNAPDESPS